MLMDANDEVNGAIVKKAFLEKVRFLNRLFDEHSID